MGGPVCVGAACTIRREESRCRRARVAGFQTIDRAGLDQEWDAISLERGEHARNQIACDLRGDDIVCHAELHLARIISSRQKPKQTVVDVKDILTMLVAVIKTSRGQLRELTCSIEALRSQRVRRRGKDAPESRCGGVGVGPSKWRGVIIETLVRTIPCIILPRERVRCIGSALVVTVDDMNVLELVAWVDLFVLRTTNMRHVTPVVSCCGSQQRWLMSTSTSMC